MRNKTLVALVVMLVVGVAACGSDGGSSSDSGGSTPRSGSATVMAPASAKPVLDELVTAFQAANPSAKVVVTTEAQPAVLSAAAASGKADVVVTVATGSGAPPAGARSFGRNLAVIAVPDANPKSVENVSVFKPGSGAKTVVCSTKTSLGDLSQLVLSKSQVNPAPATVNAAANCAPGALAQVAAGSVDAVLYFRNGVKVPAGVKLVQIPDAQNVVFDFAYVAKDDANAKAFGDFIESAQGQKILTENGYLP